MKRDMDLVRAILITLEESGGASFEKESSVLYNLATKFPELVHDKNLFIHRVINHLELLQEGGFITSDGTGPMSDFYEEILIESSSLTWQGHELLADIRDEELWKKIKKLAGEHSLAVLKDVAFEVAKKALIGG